MMTYKIILQNQRLINFFYHFINLNSKLLALRNFPDLFQVVRNECPGLTNFSDACIIIYSKKGFKLVDSELFFIGDILNSGNNLFIKFPLNIGLTGIAFNNKKIYLGYNGSCEKLYVSEIDNLMSLPLVNNIVVIPLVDDKNCPLGILHLYNKKDKLEFNDKKRLNPLKRMIGICIRNLLEMSDSDFLHSFINQNLK